MPTTLLAPAPEANTDLAPAAPPGAPPRRWLRWAVRLTLLLAAAWLVWNVYYVYFGCNFHAVVPGKIYRCAQPGRTDLEAWTKRHGIRTVFNLRGGTKDQDWYLEEMAAVHDLGLSAEDFSFSAKRLPSSEEIQRLVDALDHAEPPILLHCRQGADRTGVAAVIARLLYTDDTLPEALRHLSWRYGHLPVAETRRMDAFFDLYADWLKATGKEHAPATFRAWVAGEYRGGWCQEAIEAVEPLQEVCKAGEPLGFKVRVRNTSKRPWQFRPFMTAGYHLGVEVLKPDNTLAKFVRGGLFARDLGPGEAVELTVTVPPLAEPGVYRARFDMIEEGHLWFAQAGGQGREERIVVHE
ncbi:MAG: tyrosine-protein phosphatase [Gemmataceae bacterium]